MANLKITDHIACLNFPCQDINKECYILPDIDIDPETIKILMISEAPPPDLTDYFYSDNSPFYMETTMNAFKDAGFNVSSIEEILDLGVYITTAIKCGKIGYTVSAATIKHCSKILEEEISQFPNVQCFLLMGDVAIKAFYYITKRKTGKRVIPRGSTYKIRKEKFHYEDKRAFPSYLQTGKNYLIEKSKRKMIAEDIRNALNEIKNG